jgi:hypothetical protein
LSGSKFETAIESAGEKFLGCFFYFPNKFFLPAFGMADLPAGSELFCSITSFNGKNGIALAHSLMG